MYKMLKHIEKYHLLYEVKSKIDVNALSSIDELVSLVIVNSVLDFSGEKIMFPVEKIIYHLEFFEVFRNYWTAIICNTYSILYK